MPGFTESQEDAAEFSSLFACKGEKVRSHPLIQQILTESKILCHRLPGPEGALEDKG